MNTIDTSEPITWEVAWDVLVEYGIATEDELRLVVAINGTSVETLEDVLYVRTGLRSFDQLDCEE